MPSEAQLKSQMQAAIAKKKKEQEAKPEPKSKPESGSKSKAEPTPTESPKSESTPQPPKPATSPTVEIAPKTPASPALPNSSARVIVGPEEIPDSVTFFGQQVRILKHNKHIYFSIEDLLPLSKNPEYQNIFIDYTNNPKTKTKADEMIEILTFNNEDGSDKTPGATAQNILTIMRDLEFNLPGPLGRWLNQIDQTFSQKH